VSCPEHGVVVAAVPWADHNARSTSSSDEQAAWLAVHCSQSAVAELMRASWRTVGWIMALNCSANPQRRKSLGSRMTENGFAIVSSSPDRADPSSE
jgi:transposase